MLHAIAHLSRADHVPPFRPPQLTTTINHPPGPTRTCPSPINYNCYRDRYYRRYMADTEATYSPAARSCRVRLAAGQQQQQRHGTNGCDQTERDSASEEAGSSLIRELIRAAASHRLVSCLLLAALAISIANTVWLARLVKLVQRQEKGFKSGKIIWDRETRSSHFHLATHLEADKSISLDSIESDGDRALRVNVVGPAAGGFLCTTMEACGGAASKRGHPLKSNYLGLTESNNAKNRQKRNKALRVATSARFALNSIMNNNSASLVELDAPSLTISLGQEEELKLMGAQQRRSTSTAARLMTVQGELKSPEVTGSYGQNLDVQTRHAQLAAASRDQLRLIARAGPIQATSFASLLLSSPALELAPAKHLYLTRGIHYYDQEMPGDHWTDREEDGLRAFPLVAINGLLAAASA